jgi:hypothetical protein
MDTLAVLSGAIHPLLCTVRLWRPKAASIAAIGQPYATSVSTKTMVASGVRRLYKGVPLRAPKVFWQTLQRYRWGEREWMLMLPCPHCAVAGQSVLGQNTLCGSMRFLPVWSSERFYLDPHPIAPISQLSAHLPHQEVYKAK